MVFIYVTGRGTDSTEQGRLMWARVKGKTENDLLKLPFKAAYMFRPAGIQPLHGIRSEDRLGSGDLCRGGAAAVVAQSCRAEIHDHDRAGRPRHDQGGAGRLSEAGSGKRGYQRGLTSFQRDAECDEPGCPLNLSTGNWVCRMASSLAQVPE